MKVPSDQKVNIPAHSYRVKLLLGVLLLLNAGLLPAATLTDTSELYWQQVAANELPDNAFALLDDGGKKYYSCRPVYRGADPGLVKLFRNLAGTLGMGADGTLTCNYLIYAPRSLVHKQSLTLFLPDDQGLLEQFNQVSPDLPLFSSRTSPGTPFEVLSAAESDQTAITVSYTGKNVREEDLAPSQTFSLNDTTVSNTSFQFNGGSGQCQSGRFRVDIAGDIFCIPTAEYCRVNTSPLYSGDGVNNNQTLDASEVFRHDVIGITFPGPLNEAARFSDRCYWRQDELTIRSPDYQKVLFTQPALTTTDATITESSGNLTISSPNTEPATDSRLATYTAITTIIASVALIGFSTAIPITIFVMYAWHRHRLKVFMSKPIELRISATLFRNPGALSTTTTPP